MASHRFTSKRVLNETQDEVALYCHSSQREEKDRAIQTQVGQRYEAALAQLNAGLSRKRTTKKFDKVMIRIGRLKQRLSTGITIL